MQFVNLGNGKIENLTSKQGGRYSFEHVFFNKDRGHLAATNGSALAVVHCVPDADEVSGYIPRKPLELFRSIRNKHRHFGDRAATIRALKDKIIVSDLIEGEETSFRRPQPSSSFANYDGVIPNGEQVSGPPVFTVNVALLMQTIQALGHPDNDATQTVAIWPHPRNDGSILVKTSTHGALGVLMPVRAEKDGWLTTLPQMDEYVRALTAPPQTSKKKAAIHVMPETETPAAETEQPDGETEQVADETKVA